MKSDAYVSSESSPNSDSDGSQPLKLLNNPTIVASLRLQMKKRAQDDEKLPPLHTAEVYLGPHTTGASHMVGVSNTAGVSNTVGASNTANASNITGASDTTGASNTAGTNTPSAAIAL
jgi:hypothetical protein